MAKIVPVGVSNRHIHLSQEHINTLFGEGFSLTIFKDLSQPGQYACNEKVDLVGPKGTIKGVRVLGPARPVSQVEISLFDGFTMGVKPPVRNSGDTANSVGCKIVGPCGEVEITEGVIAAARHIHMHTSDAENFNLKDKDVVSVKVAGDRGGVFDQVLVRVHNDFALEFHIDLDEANAFALGNGATVEIL
ncbi:MAG: phosphate propanoyltransferase [Lachnospirales bacterium]